MTYFQFSDESWFRGKTDLPYRCIVVGKFRIDGFIGVGNRNAQYFDPIIARHHSVKAVMSQDDWTESLIIFVRKHRWP
jgi:hypothetical protein